MRSTFLRVLNMWRAAGIPLAPALDTAVIEQRFRAASLDVASDLVVFYATVGGMIDNGTDAEHLWSCWSVERILQEAKTYKRKGVAFADWCIHSHIHVVRCESAARSSVWVDFGLGPQLQKVSDSLEDFFERYLAKDETTFVYFDEPSIRNRVHRGSGP